MYNIYNMDVDAIIGILSKLDPDSLWSMCSTNREYMRVCKENKDIILRNILREYNVNYEEPRSLIYMDRVMEKGRYIYRYISMDEYKKEDGSYKLGDIFMRYKRLWYNESGELNLGGLGLRSIPRMPKLRRLVCEGNELSELPDFESLEYLDCSGNGIKKLGRMPMLVELNMDNNLVEEVGGMENLEYLEGGRLLKLRRLYSMPRLELVSATVGGKIKLEDMRCEEVILSVIGGRDKLFEESVPETSRSYIMRMDVRLIE